ncbi:uncharacterized protein HMPREF1541_03069 [Cyphellophora europaea CBS 101466]|uniref:Ribonuclease H2 subunit B n=1 Tax=Cyphellophora europaea (strain CBS 101466) TaxID=1220924 RepID=W2RZL6_CYPE1|nr:uncharacterized protein HMPREF1541_03069 [Cyphellophora europaea CBS 101466]ETN41134.1 hypothetical protein HMPREF1541_03069 [Cyphellophora europaea CBS 101466]
MGVKTRSASSSPVKMATPTLAAQTSNVQQQEPLKVLLLPTNLSSEARILNLRHPLDGSSKRFLFCPKRGLYEFTRVCHPPSEYRSILLSKPQTRGDGPAKADDSAAVSDGYVTKDAQMMVATPFDLCFVLLAVLPSSMAGSPKALFQPVDDLFENSVAEDKHLQCIITQGPQLIEEALKQICDTVDAGDETMYRISEVKTTAYIQQKIARVVERGLPPSLEERFVARALETPVLSVKREQSTLTVVEDDCTGIDEGLKMDSFDSQSSAPSTAPSIVFSEVSTVSSTAVTTPADSASSEITNLQRQRVALDFIITSYMSPKLAAHLLGHFQSPQSPINFTPLEQHMEQLAKLKAEALATRSLGDFSRKRELDEEEAAEERAEKKRKQDEEDKRRKASQSRGVKDLAKANVVGMKKMSDFFAKKPAAKTKS